MYNNIGGQAIGGSTAAVLGIATLPYTGGNDVLTALSLFSVASGALVLASFTLTRFIKKVI